MSCPLFGIVPAGQPLIMEPTSTPSQTSVLYALPTAKSFSHIVVFLLPNVALPDNTAAAIYLATASDVAAAAQSGAAPNFRFLGAIGPGKESAMFKVGSGSAASSGGLMLGVSVEPADAVGQRLHELAADKTAASSQQPTTAVLAQRIIQNAFNFLASFSGTAGPGGVEVVPLRAFEDWWRKFESRVRSDPSFLEKQSD
ncbi:Protein OPI10 [Tolypocladium capitatum]|uniref:Protein OPI10 n=1 Tax=Tolypocladium capitatum TaxID=45235 RepID=A0A2K3QFG7_9HYPO|nr:Protein OPI10 [Tolypocladium capitatum]